MRSWAFTFDNRPEISDVVNKCHRPRSIFVVVMALTALSCVAATVVVLSLVATGQFASVAKESSRAALVSSSETNESSSDAEPSNSQTRDTADVDFIHANESHALLLKTHFSIGEAKSLNLTAVASHDGRCPLYYAMDLAGICRPVFKSEEPGSLFILTEIFFAFLQFVPSYSFLLYFPALSKEVKSDLHLSEKQTNGTTESATSKKNATGDGVQRKRHEDYGNLIHRPFAEGDGGADDCRRGFVKDMSGKCRPVFVTKVEK